METATQTEPTTREKLEAKATLHFCPMCAQTEASIQVNLADATCFRCTDCEEDFTIDEIEALIEGAARWTKTINWLLTMPAGMSD